MKVWAIGRVSLLRLTRDRTAIFFFVALPLLVILIVGATAASESSFRVGIVNASPDPLAQELAAALGDAPAIDTYDYDDEERARTDLRRSELEAVVIVPPDYDARLRDGSDTQVSVLGERADTEQMAARSAVAGVVVAQGGAVQAAQFATDAVGGTFETNLERARALSATAAPIEVEASLVDASSNILPGGFSYSAPTMLVLFVFINSVAGAAALIQSRSLGVHDRALAAPITARTLIGGETVGVLSIALLQALLIVLVGALLFDVSWGDPLAAGVLIVLWALVGAGAGMLTGTLLRTPEQASSLGPMIGIVFAMLGGCMWPLEIVPPVMQTIGHLVPHAWAVDGWVELLSRSGGIADIGRELAVLAAFAIAMLTAATLRLRSVMSG